MSVATNKDRIIAALREGGRTLGQIARDLGVSKNSVVGHAHRLRQAGHVIVTGDQPQALRGLRRVAAAPASAPKIVRAFAEPAFPRPAGGAMPPGEPATVIPFRTPAPAPGAWCALALPQHTRPRACRWPLWSSTERPTHQYCDAPRRDAGCSWCAEHAKQAFAGRGAA